MFASYSTSDAATGNLPLGANATVTVGPLLADVAQLAQGTIFADQAGTLFIEQSFDGRNWDYSVSITVVANVGQGFSQVLVAPNVRARYVNGAGVQTVMRLSLRAFYQGR